MPITSVLCHIENAINDLRKTRLARSATLTLLETAQRALIEAEHPEVTPDEETSFFRKLHRY